MLECQNRLWHTDYEVMIDMETKDILLELRRKKGLSQEELAARAGTGLFQGTAAYIEALETGERMTLWTKLRRRIHLVYVKPNFSYVRI